TPNANFNGTDTIVFTVTDSKGAAVDQSVAITVTAVNDAPTAAATQDFAVVADTPADGVVVANDVDIATNGDVLTYTIAAADQPDNGTVTIGGADGKFTYTPADGYSGSDSFVVTVTDAGGLTATQIVNVQVGPAIVTQSIDIVGPN